MPRQSHGWFALGVGLALWPSAAGASLAPGEAEQVRHEVATAHDVGRVRALVARPDLTNAEAAAAMAAAMAGTPVDAPHAQFLHELVFGPASAASRPALAPAVVRGLLARADVVLAEHQGGLDRQPAALAEVERAYALVEDIVSADPLANVPDTARAECARALLDHVAHNATLKPDVAVPPAMASVRAQAAVALVDSLPDTPSRRVDVADGLALGGARRAALIELGVLVLDSGGSDAHVAEARSMLERLRGAGEGVEAVVVEDPRAERVRGRAEVVAVDAVPPGPLSEAASPWGSETAPPPVDGSTMAMARGLASAMVRRAEERKPELKSTIERDGGEAGVATVTAMLAVDAPRTFDAAAARLLLGKRETAAWLADAVGVLAALAPPAKGPDGVVVPFGRADGSGVTTARSTKVSVDGSGAASSFRWDGHSWRVARDEHGVVTGLLRDAAPLSAKALARARPPASEGSSWSGGGLVFARLSGMPRVTLAAGPRVWVYGSSTSDAVASPAPADDVALQADLNVLGGPAGVTLRALSGSSGVAGPFKGVSLLVVPGVPSKAVLLVANGKGVETAASPVVELSGGPRQHVRMTVKGRQVEAKVGGVALETTLPEGFEHGDVALRAYGGASVEAGGWKVNKL